MAHCLRRGKTRILSHLVTHGRKRFSTTGQGPVRLGQKPADAVKIVSALNPDRGFSAPAFSELLHFPSKVVTEDFTPQDLPDFSDTRAAYSTKTTAELARSYFSLSLCQIPFLVRNSENLLAISRRTLGDRFTDYFLRMTLFGHFCAGEDEELIKPTIAKLKQAGISSILDFAAEDDGASSDTAEGDPRHQARVYDYESEELCDRHVGTFLKCIKDVSELGSDGFAAIKVTALTNPKLLERMSLAIVETRNLFAKFDQDGNGILTKEEFQRGFDTFFKGEGAMWQEAMETSQLENGMIDYIMWSSLLKPSNLPQLVSKCRDIGPLYLSAPTEEEIDLMETMFTRGHQLAKEASNLGVRLLVDAEQVRFQPAIDNFVLELQRVYNANDLTAIPIIYNTYQCYLKDTPERLLLDIERSQRFNYRFGTKLVRGAYMESEREIAKDKDELSPIHVTINETHACYNWAVETLLRQSAEADSSVELMLATHNQNSIERAIVGMQRHGIKPNDSTVCFGQLLGMSDDITFNLGKHGYRAYKYLPYGEVQMVMPYLIRRANENSSVASSAAKEMVMMRQEIGRRVFG